MAENINIAGRLHSTATGNVVAGANEIYDDTKGKKQSVVNQETDAALDDRYPKSQTYNKTELNSMITTPNQEYETVTATDQTTAVTDVLPATGSADTVYRVGSWNGTQYEEGAYSEYSWNGSTYIHLSTKTEVGEVYDISAAHATGGELATYADLAAALGTNGANIPQSLRKGGMSVKFVLTSDNQYVQYRLTADEFTTDVNEWQGVFDTVEDDNNIATGKGIKANTVEEKEHLSSDNDVAGYITDKNKSVIAKLMKNGAVEWLVKNSNDIANDTRFENIEDFLSYVSSEVPDSGNGVIKYLTDRDGYVIATINNVGETSFLAGGGFDGELTKSRNIGLDAVKVLTDNKGSVIGWITSKGEVHIEDLNVNNLEVNGNTDLGVPEFLWPLIGIVASGLKNRDVVNDKTYNLLESFSFTYIRNGKNVPSVPSITLYDDDAIDYQIPDSQGGAISENRWGYASLLFIAVHAFNKRYEDIIEGRVSCFEAAEGQRIGLTALYADDSFDGHINSNGEVLKKLIETGEWEAVCHSMNARYEVNSYVVNGLDSEFAGQVLAGGEWHGNFRYNTTTCYDTVTKKNYQITSDNSGWTEIPYTFAKPYLYPDFSKTHMIINPSYSVEYQVGEWFKRADIAEFPYSMKNKGKRVYANWGSTRSIWHTRQNLKYADYGFAGTARTNKIPLNTVVYRAGWDPDVKYSPYSNPGNFNLYTFAQFDVLKEVVDECVENRGWSVLGSHSYEYTTANYYLPNLLSFTPAGSSEPINVYEETLPNIQEREEGSLFYYDPDYPSEWAIPLKYNELMDIIGENTHDYLNNPPSRLNISTWDEWYPCPGTGLAMLWDMLKYAISQGVRFITAEEGFEKFGNLLTIGFKGTPFDTDKRLGNIPEETTSHCIIGADGSIDYNSK